MLVRVFMWIEVLCGRESAIILEAWRKLAVKEMITHGIKWLCKSKGECWLKIYSVCLQGSSGVDTALLYEAHGLVTEMLLDSQTLPPNILAGLKALATLLKPTPAPIHCTPRPRPAPLTLSTDPDYTSDVDEIPYTGEKLSSMPKVIQHL